MTDEAIQVGDLLRLELGSGAVHQVIVSDVGPGEGPDERYMEFIPDPFDEP